MSGSVAVTIVINWPLSASSDNQHEYDDCSNLGALSLTSKTVRKKKNYNIEKLLVSVISEWLTNNNKKKYKI